MSQPLRITNVITGLEIGGAEVILSRLLAELDLERWPSTVLSLTGRGALGDRVAATGADLQTLEMHRVPTPMDLRRLDEALFSSSPDVIQTWLLHANVLAGSAAHVRKRAPVCWSMHMTAAEAGTHGLVNVGLQRAEAKLSRRVPEAIASCSYSTFELMREQGYDLDQAEVIPNGFDTSQLRPDPDAAVALRTELAIAAEAPLIAHAARWHPMKDHRNLLEAVGSVTNANPDAVFVLCGTGIDRGNPELAAMAAPHGDSVRLLGARNDVTRIFQAADLAVLSSATGEAMPLVIGEAMACGTPFVSTDCGDSAELIGDTGRVVPTRDPAALATAINGLLALPAAERRELGAKARKRIQSRYSMSGMVTGYQEIWRRLSGQRTA